MKTRILFRILSLSMLFVLLGSLAIAQDTSTGESKQREKEMKIKQAQIEKQQQEMKQQQLKMRELQKVYAEQARSSARSRTTLRTLPHSGSSDESSYYIVSSDQENQSQLTLRNSFDGVTDSSEGEFDVAESTTHIRCMINGKVRAGKITIKVLYPGGKVFKDLSITTSAEISFTQSLTINEEDKKKYVGSWSYEVSADKAKGSYMLSFMTH